MEKSHHNFNKKCFAIEIRQAEEYQCKEPLNSCAAVLPQTDFDCSLHIGCLHSQQCAPFALFPLLREG